MATGKFPGVVMMHGAPGDASGMGGIAMPVARHGAIVLGINAPFARRDKDNPLAFTPRDSAEQVQLIVDLQRAVDVLLTRSDVDASRIGFVGVSYGAAIGALFAGVERRIGAYVLLVGDGGLAAHFTKPDGNRMARAAGKNAEARWYDAGHGLTPVAYLDMLDWLAGRIGTARVAADERAKVMSAAQ